jgi:hypothetical protein
VKKITLITFQECPNAEAVRAVLRDLNVTFEDVKQDNLPGDHPYQGYSSPSVLAGEQVVIGAKLDPGASGCSVGVPTQQELEALLRGYAR